jgi:hypothetical protein
MGDLDIDLLINAQLDSLEETISLGSKIPWNASIKEQMESRLAAAQDKLNTARKLKDLCSLTALHDVLAEIQELQVINNSIQ